GWRRGFLVGSVGNLASALAWEIGLQPTDLLRGAPEFLLFTMAGPLHLLFWSSIVHVIGSFPARRDVFAGRPLRVLAVYAVPQVALLVGAAATGMAAGGTLAWIDQWAA